MAPQRAREQERLRTKVALVLPIALMNPLMPFEIVLLQKRLSANFTLEITLPQVNTVDVRLQLIA